MCCCPSVLINNQVYNIVQVCRSCASSSECNIQNGNMPVVGAPFELNAYSAAVMHRSCTVYGLCIMYSLCTVCGLCCCHAWVVYCALHDAGTLHSKQAMHDAETTHP